MQLDNLPKPNTIHPTHGAGQRPQTSTWLWEWGVFSLISFQPGRGEIESSPAPSPRDGAESGLRPRPGSGYDDTKARHVRDKNEHCRTKRRPRHPSALTRPPTVGLFTLRWLWMRHWICSLSALCEMEPLCGTLWLRLRFPPARPLAIWLQRKHLHGVSERPHLQVARGDKGTHGLYASEKTVKKYTRESKDSTPLVKRKGKRKYGS